MGKRGPRPVTGELRYYSDIWYWHFKGLRDGLSIQEMPQLDFVPRKLSTHPALAEELKNEPTIRMRWIRGRIRGVPAERELWEALLRADTPRRVRAICRKSKYWLNPRWGGRVYTKYLQEHAALFVEAKKHRRYPKSARPTSDEKRMRFLAHAMAGIIVGRKLRRVLDLLAKHGSRAHQDH